VPAEDDGIFERIAEEGVMEDLHKKKAAEIFGVPEDEVMPEQRQAAKEATLFDRYFGEEPALRRVEVKGPNFQQAPKNADWIRQAFEKVDEPKWQVLEFDVGPDEDGGRSVRMITRDADEPKVQVSGKAGAVFKLDAKEFAAFAADRRVVSKGRTPGLSAMSAAAAVSPSVSMALAAAAERETQDVRAVFEAGRRAEHRTQRQSNLQALQALLAQAALQEGMLMMPAALTGPRRTLINVAVRNALRQWRVA
jgi:hypothetical protein